MRRTWTTGALLTLAILFAATAGAQDGDSYNQTENIVYAEDDGIGLIMDVFEPKGDKNGLGIVDVVSGAWHSDRGKIRDHKQAGMYDVFCARGYTVFGIRPGSVTKFTAEEMLDHIRSGIRYVKAHAAEYGIDPDRLGIVGASAGGHLASLTAITAEEPRPDEEDPLKRPGTGVKAAAVFFPPTDFLQWGDRPMDLRKRDRLFAENADKLSDEELKERARKASPALIVDKALPTPFLIIHGDADPMVPLSQSEKLVKAINDNGGSAKLIVKPGGAHPWPTIREEVVVMADWLDEQLKAQ